ncbi:MAG: histidine phosphatase family protein [Gammaproteobacteria bacterium]|nr:histidine phosphatase family protein [Gammaproteobacteria bacterium]
MKTPQHKFLISPCFILFSVLFVSSPLFAANNNNGKLTIYLTRHAEKETMLTPSSAGVPNGFYQVSENRVPMLTDTPIDDETGEPFAPLGTPQDEVCFVTKCAEILSDEGELRAALLASWLQQRGIIRKLDAVYASHKIRTQQTVEPTAILADLDVQPIPANATELNPESTKSTVCPTIAALRAAQSNGLDTVMVAGHSGTLYKIMGNGRDECEGAGLGLDIDNDSRFPKDDEGKVRDFGDLWKIVLLPNGEAKFKYRKNLQPMSLTQLNQAR